MKSMTGYGEASQNVRGVKITVQIRSLNHRHLDMQLRVPREYLAFEEEIRKAIRGRVARGTSGVPRSFAVRLELEGEVPAERVEVQRSRLRRHGFCRRRLAHAVRAQRL